MAGTHATPDDDGARCPLAFQALVEFYPLFGMRIGGLSIFRVPGE
jgi:hypothetical protein